MIEQTIGYKVNEAFFPTLREAQIQAIASLLNKVDMATTPNYIVAHAQEVIAILTPPKEARSRKPRKDKGIKRKNAEPSKPVVVRTRTQEAAEKGERVNG